MPLPRVVHRAACAVADRAAALLQLGLSMRPAPSLIIWLSDPVDGGALDSADGDTGRRQGHARDDRSASIRRPALQLGLLLRFGLAGLLSVPFWHAPALVHWGAPGRTRKALFSSRSPAGATRARSRCSRWSGRRDPGVRACWPICCAALLGQPQLLGAGWRCRPRCCFRPCSTLRCTSPSPIASTATIPAELPPPSTAALETHETPSRLPSSPAPAAASAVPVRWPCWTPATTWCWPAAAPTRCSRPSRRRAR